MFQVEDRNACRKFSRKRHGLVLQALRDSAFIIKLGVRNFIQIFVHIERAMIMLFKEISSNEKNSSNDF